MKHFSIVKYAFLAAGLFALTTGDVLAQAPPAPGGPTQPGPGQPGPTQPGPGQPVDQLGLGRRGDGPRLDLHALPGRLLDHLHRRREDTRALNLRHLPA